LPGRVPKATKPKKESGQQGLGFLGAPLWLVHRAGRFAAEWSLLGGLRQLRDLLGLGKAKKYGDPSSGDLSVVYRDGEGPACSRSGVDAALAVAKAADVTGGVAAIDKGQAATTCSARGLQGGRQACPRWSQDPALVPHEDTSQCTATSGAWVHRSRTSRSPLGVENCTPKTCPTRAGRGFKMLP